MEEKIHSLIRHSKLASVADQLIALLRQTISLKTQSVNDETKLVPGISKLGGLPDLPSDIAWPKWNDEPLPFIAQIRLSDIASYDQANELPHSGILYFFFNVESLETYPPTSKSWYVLYYKDDPSNLQHTSASEDLQLYPVRTLLFSSILTLPPLDSLLLEPLNLSFSNPEAPDRGRDTIDAYLTLHKQLEETNKSYASPYHQLLGHPFQVQGDLLLECQRDTHSTGDPTDWRLLLQVDSDDDLAMMWGDVGLLYFYIPQKALAECDFSQVHLIMQCG